MGRTSDTRARVRALAFAWSKDGRELSPRAIREALGGGSSTTIVDELRRFREERSQQEQDDPGRAAALAELTGVPDKAATLGPAHPSESEVQLPAEACTAGQQDAANAILVALTEQMHKALARFDAMQKRTLRDVDEARELARYWKDLAEKQQVDFRAQVESYRNGMQRETERANVLAGRLEQALARVPA